jgi:hypothetical protein
MKALSSSTYLNDRIAQYRSGAVAPYAGRFLLTRQVYAGLVEPGTPLNKRPRKMDRWIRR